MATGVNLVWFGILSIFFFPLPAHAQPAWLANAADDPSYKPRIQRISSVPMREDSEYHDPDENAPATSPVSPSSSNAQPPPTPPSHKNSAPPIPPRHRVYLSHNTLGVN